MKLIQMAAIMAGVMMCGAAYGQGMAINTSGATAHASAMLDVTATDKGVLVPRMRMSERDGIAAPAEGLLIYQTDGTSGFYYYSDSAWRPIAGGSSGGGSGGSSNWTIAGSNIYNNNSGRVGVGTSVPAARLHVADSSVLFGGGSGIPGTAGAPPATGAGRRMMWYADKAAFRAGYVSGDVWNKDSVGNYSSALGYNVKARGQYASALGYETVAQGMASVSGGYGAEAYGDGAVALGYYPMAIGNRSVALGGGTASGQYAVALGAGNAEGEQAVGINGLAFGHNTLALGGGYANGFGARAIGGGACASSSFSMALGNNIGTGTHIGSVVIGDGTGELSGPLTPVHNSDAANQMMMRFAGGYKLYSDSGLSIGAQLAPGASAWSTISDRRRKEHLHSVDGVKMLEKLSAMELHSWNYKGQDPKLNRHYGPMAQDFFAAFGNDGVGVVGNDTTINQADMDGVTFVLVQALERRTAAQEERIKRLEAENAALKAEGKQQLELMAGRIDAIETMLKAERKLTKQ